MDFYDAFTGDVGLLRISVNCRVSSCCGTGNFVGFVAPNVGYLHPSSNQLNPIKETTPLIPSPFIMLCSNHPHPCYNRVRGGQKINPIPRLSSLDQSGTSDTPSSRNPSLIILRERIGRGRFFDISPHFCIARGGGCDACIPSSRGSCLSLFMVEKLRKEKLSQRTKKINQKKSLFCGVMPTTLRNFCTNKWFADN